MNRPRKSRSFTLSQPPTFSPRKVKTPVKRSKTYTGCWTCRARGIKCDEKKPGCGNCLRSNLCCEGYHVKLVWDSEHDDGGKPVQRRTFLIAQDARQPVLGPREIRLALAKLDASDAPITVQAGPFAVFPASEYSESQGANFEILEEDFYDQVHDTNYEISEPWDYDAEDIQRQAEDGSDEDVVTHWVDGVDHEDQDNIEAAMIMMSIKQTVLPQVTTYLSYATLEERSLFRYWVTFLSGLMIPTQRHDNPFRTIFIPLALTAPTSPQESSGNVALLHAIYAVSAFNRAQLSPSDKHLLALGTKHHKIALGHLRRNLMQPDESQREAILATIITMSSIEVINGDSASWRTHLAGGRIWLQSMMKMGTTHSASASVLCQIFFCINALAVPNGKTFAGQDTPRLVDQLGDHQDTQSDSFWPMWDTAYALDKLFGITKPVLEGIVRTNTLSDPMSHATKEEIDELDLFIRRNDPDVLISDLDEEYDEITRHHTCAFFCASLIYFERRVRKTSPRKIQRLVQRSLDHLETISALEIEKNLDVCGLFWPEFVTACEAEDVSNLRGRALRMFQKGKLRGIGNISSAENVVREVWQRRDNNCEGSDITWHSTMADLGLDLLLT